MEEYKSTPAPVKATTGAHLSRNPKGFPLDGHRSNLMSTFEKEQIGDY